MWLRLVNVSACVWLGVFGAGCVAGGGSNYRSSYSMMNVQANPPNVMVAHKIQRPLYLVLDPARVKDTWQLTMSDSVNPNGPTVSLKDFQTFVTRDLKQAMSAYFTTVNVVNAGEPIPKTPHVIGDVKVDRVTLHSVPTGRLTYVMIEMTWGFGLRPSESEEYVFSFAGQGSSSESYPTFEAGCAQMVESAISGFLSKWLDKGGPEALEHPKRASR